MHYNLFVRNPAHTVIALGLFFGSAALVAVAQQAPAADSQKKDEKQPQVKYNMLNVCTPSDAEKQVLSDAIDKVLKKAAFKADFELTRGVLTLQDAKPARYLRLRREIASDGAYVTALYSLSTDMETTTETLVLKARDPKEVISLSFDDSVTSSVATPAAMLTVSTPPTRLRVERNGKPAVVLSRCEGGTQESYEPLFKKAAELMTAWRKGLGLETAFHNDMTWLTDAVKSRRTQETKKPSGPPPKN